MASVYAETASYSQVVVLNLLTLYLVFYYRYYKNQLYFLTYLFIEKIRKIVQWTFLLSYIL